MNTIATITRTRTSLPTYLRESGVKFSTTYDNGKFGYIIDGTQMTHNEVATKYGYSNEIRRTVKVCC